MYSLSFCYCKQDFITYTDRQTYIHTERQTDRQIDGNSERQTEIQKDRQKFRKIDRSSERQTEIQKVINMDRHTYSRDRKIDRQKDIQTDES